MRNKQYEYLLEKILMLEHKVESQNQVIEFLQNKMLNLANEMEREEEPKYMGSQEG